jgi:hemerythrin-like domain-containing protein
MTGADAGQPFAVTPTPDPGHRHSDHAPWDEAARPTGPDPDPDARYTAEQQAASQHLIDVHDHLRQELEQLRGLVAQLATGEVDPTAVRGHLNRMTIRQNNWTLGLFCATYCRFATGHHTLEDQSMFPFLRHREPALNPVIDRLAEEHEVIAGILEEVDQAIVALVSSAGIDTVVAAIDRLTDAMSSHLSYEERELVEPLARHGLG